MFVAEKGGFFYVKCINVSRVTNDAQLSNRLALGYGSTSYAYH